MDGVYETQIKSPMGNLNIRLALKQNGNLIDGMIEIMGSQNSLTTGKINGNKCFFSGEINNKGMSIKYNIMGELIEDILYIHAKTNMGEFKLEAKKIV